MARPRSRKLAIRAVKGLIALVVLWAVGRHIWRTWTDLRDRSESLRFDASWLVVAAVLYLVGLSAFGRFYTQILEAGQLPVPLRHALRAYLVSHLGKYVPGKAMVVVIRAGMVVRGGSKAATAAIATFYETLVMMAAGGVVATVGFALATGSYPYELMIPRFGKVVVPVYRLGAVMGLGCALVFLIVVMPRVFTRLVGVISTPIPGVGIDSVPRLTSRLLTSGMLWSTLGWIILGLSQLAVVRSFDSEGASRLISLGMVPVVIASVALATVAGFLVAVLPGGLGVREGVLMSALAPALGTQGSVVAAVALRLVWVIAELAAACVLVPWYWTERPLDAAVFPQPEASTAGADSR